MAEIYQLPENSGNNGNYGGLPFSIPIGGKSYDDGYREGYKDGREDGEQGWNEDGYRQERDSRGRYM